MKRWVFDLSTITKHQWAFFYYCRRKGDRCWVDHPHGQVVVEVSD